MRPRAGRAVVAATVRQCGRVERVDGLARRRRERRVEAGAGRGGAGTAVLDRELVLVAGDAVADLVRARPCAPVSERAEDGVVERGGALEVGDGEGEVVEQDPISR